MMPIPVLAIMETSVSPVDIPSIRGTVFIAPIFRLLLITAIIPGPGDIAETKHVIMNIGIVSMLSSIDRDFR